MIAKLAIALLATLGVFSALRAETTILDSGHSEIHFRYQTGIGFILDVWDHDNRLFFDPATTLMQVKPMGRLTAPGGLAWEDLGVPGGTTIWVIPQDNPALRNPPVDLLWFGTRSVIASSTFTTLESFPSPTGNQIGLRLVSVTGSGPDSGGHFSLFTTDGFGDPTFRFATVDGIPLDENDPEFRQADVIKPINTQSHTHYNWAFTEPGRYEITVEAYGRLNQQPPEMVSKQQTYFFEVLAPEAPPVTAVFEDGETVLSWTASGTDTYIIESTTTLREDGWSEADRVTPPAGPYSYSVESTGDRAFYRIRVE